MDEQIAEVTRLLERRLQEIEEEYNHLSFDLSMGEDGFDDAD